MLFFLFCSSVFSATARGDDPRPATPSSAQASPSVSPQASPPNTPPPSILSYVGGREQLRSLQELPAEALLQISERMQKFRDAVLEGMCNVERAVLV